MTIALGACLLGRGAITIAAISTSAVALSACGSKTVPVKIQDQNQAIKRLELRLEQLERQVDQQLPVPSDNSDKVPAGPVSSVTLRTGTADDRLRIYWADGTLSDLPCTKEQNTWACG